MKMTFKPAAELFSAFTNELSIGDGGWAQIAPFGDFPGMALVGDGQGGLKKERAIQRMDREAVMTMVNEYQQTRKGKTRFLRSKPIFLGHPDVSGAIGDKYSDKNLKGVFANLACRDDGFFGMLVLTDEGAELVATKRVRALSGRWEADFVGEENGVKIYRPVRLISAGLTDQPNLPVQLLNEQGLRKIEITNASERREMVTQFFREEQAASKCSYDDAFANVQRKFPALFNAMKQPQFLCSI